MCTYYLPYYTATDSGYGSGIRKSQLYNARGKKLAVVPITSKLHSPAISLSNIQPSSSGSSLNKDPGDVGKGRKQHCTSPNKLKSSCKQLSPPAIPSIPNSDVNPNISNSPQDCLQKRSTEVPDNIPEPPLSTNVPIKSTTSFFQRFFQR